MNKFFPKLSVKDVCTLGLLLAITIILAVFGTFRIGDIIKIPTKFISVFVAGAVFGPVWGGICAALGDLLNAVIAPVGPFLPQITMIEFASGFAYGLFFLKDGGYTANDFAVRVILCILVQSFIDMVLTTSVLVFWVNYYSSFVFAFLLRLPAGILKAALQLCGMLALKRLVDRLRIISKKP